MNTRIKISAPRPSLRYTILWSACLLLVMCTGCSPASTQQPVLPQQSPTEPQPAPTTPTAGDEDMLPEGWTTYSSQRCEYSLSYPAGMEISNGGGSSRMLSYKLANADVWALNFVYVSVINQEFQSQSGEDIYNYNLAEADQLLGLQIGESKSLHDEAQLAEWYSYQRLPDTTIGGYTAQAYENVRPWEFPSGTKEIRYYLPLEGCMLQIGGYVDTTQSNQPGAISEDLFGQIVGTVRVVSE